MSYPGGKGGAGVYQTIINEQPPHDVYIEAFLGGGAVLRHKRPAGRNIAVDRSAAALAPWHGLPGVELHRGCALDFLDTFRFSGRELVYLDPPYLKLSRRSGGDLYDFELDDAAHGRLLDLVDRLPCAVQISGYWSALYADALRQPKWRLVSFTGQTRGGPREECLWMNYPAPAVLHDYRFLGGDFRERERIKRKVGRAVERARRQPALERRAILSALLQVEREDD